MIGANNLGRLPAPSRPFSSQLSVLSKSLDRRVILRLRPLSPYHFHGLYCLGNQSDKIFWHKNDLFGVCKGARVCVVMKPSPLMNIEPQIDRDQVARILDAITAGTPGAEARLMDLVHGELKKIAVARLRGKTDCSLSPTALVSDAYLKLFGHANPSQWSGRGHFFGAAARAMRQILIDHARTKRRLKRGGKRLNVDLDLDLLPNLKQATNDELLDLDEALKTLGSEDPELVKLVELKFFAGQTTEQAAVNMGISLRAANRSWKYAKSRLWQLMRDGQTQ